MGQWALKPRFFAQCPIRHIRENSLIHARPSQRTVPYCACKFLRLVGAFFADFLNPIRFITSRLCRVAPARRRRGSTGCGGLPNAEPRSGPKIPIRSGPRVPTRSEGIVAMFPTLYSMCASSKLSSRIPAAPAAGRLFAAAGEGSAVSSGRDGSFWPRPPNSTSVRLAGRSFVVGHPA